MKSIELEPEILKEQQECELDGESTTHLRYHLPPLKKSDIDVRVLKDRVLLHARHGEKTEYHSEYMFSCCYAVAEKAKIKYTEGELTIEVPTRCD